MSCEVRMYCDTCGGNMLVDEFGSGSFREAISEAIRNAIRTGFRRTSKGWQCPGCLVGMPHAFDMDQYNLATREKASALYKKKFGKAPFGLSENPSAPEVPK